MIENTGSIRNLNTVDDKACLISELDITSIVCKGPMLSQTGSDQEHSKI
jgi:hypothetical protein